MIDEKLMKKIDAPLVEARFEESWYTDIQFRGKNIDVLTKAVERGGIVRGYDGERFATVVFNDPKKLNFSNPIKMSKKRDFPEQKTIDTEIKLEKERDPRRVSIAEKVDLTKRYNDLIIKSKNITTSHTIYRDQFRRRYYINNAGRKIIEEVAYTGISLGAIARDGTNVQSYRSSLGDQRGFRTLSGHEEKAEEVIAKTVELINAERVESGIYDCIIDPLLCGVFIHEAFGHLAEADHLYQNPELLKVMSKDRKIASEKLTVIDDPTLTLERGSYHFDDEGVEAKKSYLIKDGKINEFMHSRETALIMGDESSGNGRAIDYNYPPIVRMSNTFVLPQDSSKKEMISSLKKGLYVCGARGGQTALEDFIFAAKIGYIIEDGKVKEPVRDVILSGNVFKTLNNIVSIGSDLKIFGGLGGCGKSGQSPLPVSDGGPHVLIKGVVIGGR